MKLIGVLAGMSWESSAEYYRLLNQLVAQRLGGLASARVLLSSVDFRAVESLMSAGRWDDLGQFMAAEARRLAAGGAELLILATNTVHQVAPAITAAVDIPFLHIADAAGRAAVAAGQTRVALLGTRFTMEREFYRQRLDQNFGLEVLVPGPERRARVDHIIFAELCRGRVEPASREICREVLTELAAQGAQAAILGCTELMLLIRPQDSPLPLWDTTELHCRWAVEESLT